MVPPCRESATAAQSYCETKPSQSFTTPESPPNRRSLPSSHRRDHSHDRTDHPPARCRIAQDRGDGRRERAESVGLQLDAVDRNAGQPGSRFVAADGIDMAPPAREAEDESEDQGHGQQHPDHVGDAGDLAAARGEIAALKAQFAEFRKQFE